MAERLSSRVDPDVMTAIGLLQKSIHASGVAPATLDLVHLRASQINACGPCIFSGVAAAKKNGESDERLHNVAAWRETALFTDDERAALALAEAATRIQDNAPGVTDRVWDDVADHFDEKQLRGLVWEIALTNLFNRINHTIREQAGTTW